MRKDLYMSYVSVTVDIFTEALLNVKQHVRAQQRVSEGSSGAMTLVSVSVAVNRFMRLLFSPYLFKWWGQQGVRNFASKVDTGFGKTLKIGVKLMQLWWDPFRSISDKNLWCSGPLTEILKLNGLMNHQKLEKFISSKIL